jgi:hypothetical protein
VITRPEKLFLNTLRELETKIVSQTDYDILNASNLIRRLFLADSPALIHQVNKNYKLPLRFEVAESPPLPAGIPPPAFYSVQDAFDPSTAPPNRTHKVIKLDEFLAFPLGTAAQKPYTVRDVILFNANVMGGSHAGTARTDLEKALAQIGNALRLGGREAPLRQLQPIGRVVLKALEPLKQEVLKKLKPDNKTV